MYRRIEEELAARGLLQDNRFSYFQIITVKELEYLEIAVSDGWDLKELLSDKVGDERLRGTSFLNFMYIKDYEFSKKPNSYLQSRYEEFGEASQAFFDDRDTQE